MRSYLRFQICDCHIKNNSRSRKWNQLIALALERLTKQGKTLFHSIQENKTTTTIKTVEYIYVYKCECSYDL